MTTYTKLKSGEWGIRATSAVKPGQSVTVTKKDGSTKSETVAKVVWSGNGVWLCAIEARQPATAGRVYDNRIERNSGGMYCGYPCPVSGRRCCAANGPCHDCM